MNTVLVVALMICGVKAVMGFHFPWEKCSCCGKKYGDHTNYLRG